MSKLCQLKTLDNSIRHVHQDRVLEINLLQHFRYLDIWYFHPQISFVYSLVVNAKFQSIFFLQALFCAFLSLTSTVFTYH